MSEVWLGRCRECGHGFRVTDPDQRDVRHIGRDRIVMPGSVRHVLPPVRCHGHLVALRLVEARLNPGHVCDPRCTGAVGSQCDCSCGGRNHGLLFDVSDPPARLFDDT